MHVSPLVCLCTLLCPILVGKALTTRYINLLKRGYRHGSPEPDSVGQVLGGALYCQSPVFNSTFLSISDGRNYRVQCCRTIPTSHCQALLLGLCSLVTAAWSVLFHKVAAGWLKMLSRCCCIDLCHGAAIFI